MPTIVSAMQEHKMGLEGRAAEGIQPHQRENDYSANIGTTMGQQQVASRNGHIQLCLWRGISTTATIREVSPSRIPLKRNDTGRMKLGNL